MLAKISLLRLFEKVSFLLVIAGMATGCAYEHVGPDICFESEVLPIYVTYCSSSGCHNANDRVAGYDLTSYAGIMRGVKAGNAASSEVVSIMSGGSLAEMPPSGYPKPGKEQVALVKAWVKGGAVNTTNCNPVLCDTSATVSYANDIVPLMQNHCNGCHSGASPSAGLDMSDFATVSQNAVSGRIQGSLSGNPAYKTMPPSGGLLDACYVVKINKWVAAGTPNN